MNDVQQNALVHRLEGSDTNLRFAAEMAVDAFNEDSLFCLPADARRIFERHGANTKVILLGATPFSRTFYSEAFDRVQIVAVVDDFRASSGDTFEGLPIITSTEMLSRSTVGDVIAVSGCRYDRSRRFFRNLSRSNGVPHLNFEQALRLLRIVSARDHRIEDWGHTIASNLERFHALGDRMIDDYSRFTLYSVLMSQITCNPEWSLHAARPYCTLYFRSGLWAPSLHERFVDCGASIGESTTALIDATNGAFDRIWMIEPDRYNVETLTKFLRNHEDPSVSGRISLLACAVGERDEDLVFAHEGGHGGKVGIGSVGATVPVRRLDELLDAEPTLIKMDVEGAELSAHKGANGIIASAKPKLAISAYHRSTDLLNIVDFALSVRPDYKVGLRHHTEERWDTCLYFV